MSRHSAEHPDQIALKRIAALLLGLARMAEHASLRSFPIRFLVLWVLRPAEAYARDLVLRAARDLGYQAHLPTSSIDDIAPMIAGRGSTEALRLAMTFEMLAALLHDLVALAFAARQTVRPQSFVAQIAKAAIAPAILPRAMPMPKRLLRTAYHDTS